MSENISSIFPLLFDWASEGGHAVSDFIGCAENHNLLKIFSDITLVGQLYSIFLNAKSIYDILSDTTLDKKSKLKNSSIELLQFTASDFYLWTFPTSCHVGSLSLSAVALFVVFSIETIKECSEFISLCKEWKKLKSEINSAKNPEEKKELEEKIRTVKTEMIEKGIGLIISTMKLLGSIILLTNPMAGSIIIVIALTMSVLCKSISAYIKKRDASKSLSEQKCTSFFHKDLKKEKQQIELTPLRSTSKKNDPSDPKPCTC